MRVMASALGGLVLFGFELLGICGGGEKEKKKNMPHCFDALRI